MNIEDKTRLLTESLRVMSHLMSEGFHPAEAIAILDITSHALRSRAEAELLQDAAQMVTELLSEIDRIAKLVQ